MEKEIDSLKLVVDGPEKFSEGIISECTEYRTAEIVRITSPVLELFRTFSAPSKEQEDGRRRKSLVLTV